MKIFHRNHFFSRGVRYLPNRHSGAFFLPAVKKSSEVSEQSVPSAPRSALVNHNVNKLVQSIAFALSAATTRRGVVKEPKLSKRILAVAFAKAGINTPSNTLVNLREPTLTEFISQAQRSAISARSAKATQSAKAPQPAKTRRFLSPLTARSSITARPARAMALPSLGQVRSYHNATTLIVAGGKGMMATVIDLKQRGKLDDKEIIALLDDSWLRNVHPDWLNLQWGQPAIYLPSFLLNRFIKKFPRASQYEPMRFHHMRSLITDMYEELPSYGFKRFENHTLEKSFDGAGVILRPSNKKIQPIYINNNFHIMSSRRILRDQFVLRGISLRSTSVIYEYSKADIKDANQIVVFGSGQNLIWALRDLRPLGVQIINLIPKNESIRDEVINDETCRAILRVDDPDFQCITEHTGMVRISGKDCKTGKMYHSFIREDFFVSANGLQLDEVSWNRFPRDKITYIDPSPQKQNSVDQIDENGKILRKIFLDNRGTILPNGNFTHSYLEHVISFSKLIDYPIWEAGAILNNFYAWQHVVITGLASQGYFPSPEHFKPLRQKIVEMIKHRIPKGEEVWAVIEEDYIKNPIKGLSIENYRNFFYCRYVEACCKNEAWNNIREEQLLVPRIR